MRLYLFATSLAIFLFSLLVFPLAPQSTLAAGNGDWYDKGVIEFDGTDFIDRDPYDDQHQFRKGNNQDECVDKMYVTGDGKAKYYNLEKSENGNCYIVNEQGKSFVASDPNDLGDGDSDDGDELDKHHISVDLGKQNRRQIGAHRIDDDTLEGYIYWDTVDKDLKSGNNPRTKFKRFDKNDPAFKADTYYWNGDPKEAVFIKADGKNSQICIVPGLLEPFDSSADLRGTQCKSMEVDNAKPRPPEGTTGSGSDKPADNTIDCDAGVGLTWIVCSLIDFANGVMGWIRDNIIEPFLTTAPLKAEGGDQIFEVWKTLRTIANVLLIPIFLVIIFSQALALNIDAYAVKKILPRLLAAVILVQFSFYIVSFLVDTTNVLGKGIDNLILAPFASDLDIQESGGSGLEEEAASGALLSLGALGAVVGVTAALSAAGTGAVFLILVPALIGMIAVFFTLVLRNIIIIALAILAPVAFVSWVLPGTDKLFRQWWDTLLKALMMYPLIILLFAAATIVATISSNLNESAGENTVGQIVSVAAVIAPLFLIPFTFRFAGGAIAAIATGVGNISNRAAYGKDGKGGMMAGLRERVNRRRIDQANEEAPDTWLGRKIHANPTLRKAAAYGARPGMGFGNRAAEAADMAWRLQRAKDAKDMQDAGMTIDQLGSLVRYPNKEALQARIGKLNARADRLEATGDIVGAERKREEARNLQTAWNSVQTMAKDSSKRAAAAVALADMGFAKEEDIGHVQSFLTGRGAYTTQEMVKGAMVKGGQRSALAWGKTGGSRERELLDQVSKLGSEDLLKIKDWDAFAGVDGDTGAIDDKGLMRKILRAESIDPDRNPETDRNALANKLMTALADTSDTTLGRRQDIVKLLESAGIPIQAIQPPSSTSAPTRRRRGR